MLEEVVADLVCLRSRALVLRQRGDHRHRREIGEHSGFSRRQRTVVDPYFVEIAVESIVRPAACADTERLPPHRPLAVDVIKKYFERLILAVDVDLDAGRPARPRVGQRHVMPLVQTDRLPGAESNAFIHPLGDVVVLNLSISQVETVSVGLEHVFVPRHDRTAWRRGIDPRSHRVPIVVGDSRIVRTEGASSGAVAVKPGDVAAELNEALPIEARRLPDLTG